MLANTINTFHVHYLKLVTDREVHAPPYEASAIGTIAQRIGSFTQNQHNLPGSAATQLPGQSYRAKCCHLWIKVSISRPFRYRQIWLIKGVRGCPNILMRGRRRRRGRGGPGDHGGPRRQRVQRAQPARVGTERPQLTWLSLAPDHGAGPCPRHVRDVSAEAPGWRRGRLVGDNSVVCIFRDAGG